MLILSIPLSKLLKFNTIRSTKKQILISSIVIIACMLSLASLCISEGIIGRKLITQARHYLPVPFFAIVTFFYVAGISRNLWLLMQQVLSSFSLQLHLRAVSTAISWLVIFTITKILPQLLYMVGVGYVYAYSVIFMLVALIFIHRIVPSDLIIEVDKAIPIANSLSSCTSQSQHSSFNEINQVEV